LDFNKLLTRCLAADQFIVCVTEKRNIAFLAIISDSVLNQKLVDFNFSLLMKNNFLSFLNHLLLPAEPLCSGRPLHALWAENRYQTKDLRKCQSYQKAHFKRHLQRPDCCAHA
jgi:hypothetical protein